MTHRNIVAALAVAVALVATAAAQAKTDFSGTWTFDEAKSDPAPARAGGGGGGGGRGGGRMGGAPATAMTIKQTGAELTMDRTMAQGPQTVTLKLDGTDSTNTIGMGPATSKAVWDGPRLVVTTTQTMQGRGGGGEITITSKEIYSVSGNVLTIETTRTTPAGDQTRK